MNEKKQKQRGLKQGFELIYKYRFVLSFLLLIMLVSFKISGSSMGCWKLFLGDGESGIRLGEPRVWRSDEWGTLTPLVFVSNIIRLVRIIATAKHLAVY